MQSTSKILMIRPANFSFNAQTAESNAFQKKPGANESVHKKALREFDDFVELLVENRVEVTVIQDTLEPFTPDSIFPNNWISTHEEGEVFLYPMQAENRRLERKSEIITVLKDKFLIKQIIDLSYFEKENKFLESTGSMVLDRQNKLAYSCISPRTHPEVLNRFAELTRYRIIPFHAFDTNGKPIYHTNVLMCVGEKFGVICAESIVNPQEKKTVLNTLVNSGKEVIEISFEQMTRFAGNMLQLRSRQDEDLLVMSEQAYQTLTPMQMQKLSRYSRILNSPLYTIESSGGGSARCMIAEIHLNSLPVA